MTDEVKPTSSKKLPTIAIVGIGCIALLVLIGVGLTIAGKVLFSKFGANLVQKGIESKTGVKIDTNGKTGSFTMTDAKTGETVNIGEQKIPDNFPKDFPLYPGAKSTGSISGNNNKEQSQGYWIVMTSTDDFAKVKTFYETNLPKNGWGIENTMTINDMNTFTVKKGLLTGGVTINKGDKDNETTITISLASSKENGSTNSDPSSDTPADDGNM